MSSSIVYRSRVPCRYYQLGACRFGETCRFSHIDLSENDAYNRQILSTTSLSVLSPPFIPSTKTVGPSSDHSTAYQLNGGLQNELSYAQVVGAQSNPAIGQFNTQSFYPMELCEFCQQHCLHPTDENLRKKHIAECIKQHEREMENAFALARSQGKQCGICIETVIEKQNGCRRFGILPMCNHIFCLDCIRKWRNSTNYENNNVRRCPECRVNSDFVCPSKFWVETDAEKDQLINDYKAAMLRKDCKYFRKGDAKCPFGNLCFYRHALPSGKLVDVGPPQHQRRERTNDNWETDSIEPILLWEFLSDHYGIDDEDDFYTDDDDDTDGLDDLDDPDMSDNCTIN